MPGNKLASSSFWDKTIRIWDIQSGTVINQLEGHSDTVRSLILMKDGITMASASVDKTIRLWNIETGTFIKTLHGHKDKIDSLAILEDGRLISCSWDKAIIIWK